MTRIADDFSAIKRRMDELNGTAPPKGVEFDTYLSAAAAKGAELAISNLPPWRVGSAPYLIAKDGPELFVPGGTALSAHTKGEFERRVRQLEQQIDDFAARFSKELNRQ